MRKITHLTVGFIGNILSGIQGWWPLKMEVFCYQKVNEKTCQYFNSS